ncbi:MAG: hypothetical protein U0354_14910 [Candidatus Sericytochromatia bacterium]
MKKYLYSLFSLVLISSFQNEQAIAKNKIDSKVGRLITNTSIGKIKLGMKYYDVFNILKNYKPEIHNGADASDEWSGLSSEIISVSDLYRNEHKIVKEIITCNPQFLTIKGIRVGMAFSQLEKIYPNINLRIDALDGIEFFSPNDYKNMRIDFETKNQETIGLYSDIHGESTSIKIKNRKAQISCITIRKD